MAATVQECVFVPVASEQDVDVMKSDLQHSYDSRSGRDWWDARSKEDQAAWLARVRSARPDDAWEAFERSLAIVR